MRNQNMMKSSLLDGVVSRLLPLVTTKVNQKEAWLQKNSQSKRWLPNSM